MSIQQFVSDEVIKYLKERDELVTSLQSELNEVKRILGIAAYWYKCSICSQYKPHYIRCGNYSKGCTFSLCSKCEDVTSFQLFNGGHSGHVNGFDEDNCRCTEQCYLKYKDNTPTVQTNKIVDDL